MEVPEAVAEEEEAAGRVEINIAERTMGMYVMPLWKIHVSNLTLFGFNDS